MGKLHGTNIDWGKSAVNVLIVDEVDSDKVTIEEGLYRMVCETAC